MQIPEKHFLKFKELMREKLGDEEYSKLTEQELLHSAISLVTLMKAVYQPITKEDYEKFHAEERVDKGYDVLFKETEKRNSGKRGGGK